MSCREIEPRIRNATQQFPSGWVQVYSKVGHIPYR